MKTLRLGSQALLCRAWREAGAAGGDGGVLLPGWAAACPCPSRPIPARQLRSSHTISPRCLALGTAVAGVGCPAVGLCLCLFTVPHSVF